MAWIKVDDGLQYTYLHDGPPQTDMPPPDAVFWHIGGGSFVHNGTIYTENPDGTLVNRGEARVRSSRLCPYIPPKETKAFNVRSRAEPTLPGGIVYTNDERIAALAEQNGLNCIFQDPLPPLDVLARELSPHFGLMYHNDRCSYWRPFGDQGLPLMLRTDTPSIPSSVARREWEGEGDDNPFRFGPRRSPLQPRQQFESSFTYALTEPAHKFSGSQSGRATAMGGWSANNSAHYDLSGVADDTFWEWLHLRADSLGGLNTRTNLGAGSYQANTQMIPFERALARLSRYSSKTNPVHVTVETGFVPIIEGMDLSDDEDDDESIVPEIRGTDTLGWINVTATFNGQSISIYIDAQRRLAVDTFAYDAAIDYYDRRVAEMTSGLKATKPESDSHRRLPDGGDLSRGFQALRAFRQSPHRVGGAPQSSGTLVPFTLPPWSQPSQQVQEFFSGFTVLDAGGGDRNNCLINTMLTLRAGRPPNPQEAGDLRTLLMAYGAAGADDMLDVYGPAGVILAELLGMRFRVVQIQHGAVIVHPVLGTNQAAPIVTIVHYGMHFMPAWPKGG